MSESQCELTVFYDGLCPLCNAEMRHLKKNDSENKIALVDITSACFPVDYPHLDKQTLNDRIHGLLADGQMISGLDVTYKAWDLVGKGWIYAPLRWPLIRPLADVCYTLFAKHRYRISFLLTGKRRCKPCEASRHD